MGSLPQISGREMVRVLERQGFIVAKQRGSHIKLIKIDAEVTMTVIVPDHKIVKPGTLRSICKQIKIDPHSLRSLL